MKQGTIVSINGWHDLLPGGSENYGIVVSSLDSDAYTICMVRGPSEGQVIKISPEVLKVEEALPDNDRERRLEGAVRLARLSFMAYQLNHEKKRGVNCEKALTNAALVDTMNEALV